MHNYLILDSTFIEPHRISIDQHLHFLNDENLEPWTKKRMGDGKDDDDYGGDGDGGDNDEAIGYVVVTHLRI